MSITGGRLHFAKLNEIFDLDSHLEVALYMKEVVDWWRVQFGG
jgi:hypothetical protein